MAHRPIRTIASEIVKEWKNPYFGARPYLQAMLALNGPEEMYGAEDAKGIIVYFLANANTYRGPVAKAHKLELKAML